MPRGNQAKDSQSLLDSVRILRTPTTKLENSIPDHGYVYPMFVHEFKFL